jgi:Uma2 family endonuclease
MRTTFVMDPPPIVEDWLAQRRALGQDRFDEVWEGEYHVAPAPHRRHARLDDTLGRMLGPLADHAGLMGATTCNIGIPTDYRIPDRAYFRSGEDLVWNPTAAVVIEILSPEDEGRAKLPFYFRAGVEEVLLIDPDARTVEWFGRGADAFEPSGGSSLLGISSTELAERIDWPQG